MLAQQRPVADIEARYTRHRDHHNHLYAQGWSRQRVINLFAILGWMLALPKPLEQQVWQDIDDVKRKPT